MNSITNYFASLNLDIIAFLKTTAMLIGALLLLALIGRFAFGKKSALCRAVSSAIGIFFLYLVTVVLGDAGTEFKQFIAPLPFVTIENDTMYLFSFQADYIIICSEVLNMIILSFLMNITDSWLPTGKHILSWVFFRSLGVVIALILHLIATSIIAALLPEGLISYAPVVLLALLVLMLLTGSLKLLVGILLTTVNPLVAALYTFFFANVIGKQITKAVLTTGILGGLIYVLQELGITAISIASAAFAAYIPLIILILILWYIVGKLL